MRLHQVLSGSCNPGDCSLSKGSIGSFDFLAYASGSNVLVIDKDFVRVQNIHFEEGIVHHVSCCRDSGKIAAYNNIVIHIFKPIITAENNSFDQSKNVNFKWNLLSTIQEIDYFMFMSWMPASLVRSTEYLITCKQDGSIILYCERKTPKQHTFTIGSEPHVIPGLDSEFFTPIWNQSIGGEVSLVLPSFDGDFFLTVASFQNETSDVRIWFNVKSYMKPTPNSATNIGQFPGPPVFAHSSEQTDEIRFDYFTLPHPCKVHAASWRERGRFQPRSWCPNVLITSGSDGLIRFWIEQQPLTLINNACLTDELLWSATLSPDHHPNFNPQVSLFKDYEFW
ncbi:DmX-like protein 1 [Cichlidogyrus casuarinus]|uniref:DmX-like protein 1 n=1 Tax=Cichlidogyrus casuarinus TaxID=1844966 RepID=A0ABD2Q5W7_9PLAT